MHKDDIKGLKSFLNKVAEGDEGEDISNVVSGLAIGAPVGLIASLARREGSLPRHIGYTLGGGVLGAGGGYLSETEQAKELWEQLQSPEDEGPGRVARGLRGLFWSGVTGGAGMGGVKGVSALSKIKPKTVDALPRGLKGLVKHIGQPAAKWSKTHPKSAITIAIASALASLGAYAYEGEDR